MRAVRSAFWNRARLFVENEEDSHYEAQERGQMIPSELIVEQQNRKDRKDGERDALLDDFELHEIEWTAVGDEADAIGRHHEAVLEKRDAPGKKHDAVQRPGAEIDDLQGLQFEVQIPLR